MTYNCIMAPFDSPIFDNMISGREPVVAAMAPNSLEATSGDLDSWLDDRLLIHGAGAAKKGRHMAVTAQ